VLLSTASPYKFSPAVLEALGESTEGLSGFDCMDRLEALTGTQAPAPLAALREAPVRFRDEIEREAMPAYVEDACKRLL
jgi:threonine synthase